MAAASRFPRLLFLAFCLTFLPLSANDGTAAAARPADSVVTVAARVPADSRTADSLGTERRGGGVVIDQGGLVLTIGYLIMEAIEVTVADSGGGPVPAEIVAYDHDTGFGLLRALRPLRSTAARLGSADRLVAGQRAVAAAPGISGQTLVVGRRSFAGGWEYLLEEALFTTPPIPNFGGAGLFDAEGRLVGIGSLIVGDAAGDGVGPPGNMFVPIDLLPPILSDLLAFGKSTTPASPWIGLYPEPANGALVVARVSPGGPAAAAGIRPGDVILGIGDQPVRRMEALWRGVRALGPAGVEVPLKILSGGAVRDVTVKSRDRRGWLRLDRTY
ncbi:MAG: S1C family serine protease [Thalassobaculum sp.]|uniref:S1C family serine protease n=1 Tax=Thalassobaculum sp. TaxID=2022740 RepID=UPI0032ECE23B